MCLLSRGIPPVKCTHAERLVGDGSQVLEERNTRSSTREINLNVLKCLFFFYEDIQIEKLISILGHSSSLNKHLSEMVPLPQPFLNWPLTPQIQLEHHSSIQILHLLISVGSCGSDGMTLF